MVDRVQRSFGRQADAARHRAPQSPVPEAKSLASSGVDTYVPKLLPGPGALQPKAALALQRTVGNRATTIAIQRHQLDPGREGEGEESDEIVQRRTGPATAGVQRTAGHRSTRRSASFGRTSPAGAGTPLWGNGGHALQRDKGGTAVKVPPGADPKAPVPEGDKGVPDPDVLAKALKEYKSFVDGGPYTKADFVPDFTENFGKFDTKYDPGARQLDISMRIKFTFPDLPVPKVTDIQTMMQAIKVRAIRAGYVTNFLGQVHKGWSGKFQFKNIREPQAVWGKLNPVSVKLNVTPTKTNEHYTMKAYLNKKGTANVSPNPAAGKKGSGTVTFFKGDIDSSTQDFTGDKNTAPHEIARLQRNLPKIRFANNSADIDAKYIPDLIYVADYLKRMNRPKFQITAVGHANKTGGASINSPLSAKRAANVRDKLKGFGVSNHDLDSIGVGSQGATAHGSWRKVDFRIKTDPSFSNVQDTTLHEFGHMLGLDDEYVAGRAIQLQHQRNFVRKMLGNPDYGPGQENKYADEVSKVDALQSASVMYSGDEIRAQHYVTMWQALYNVAETAKAPVPAFTFKDWKVVE